MKKLMYFTLMVMLSMTLIGPSVAEEKAKSNNRVASINEEGVKPNNQSAVEEKNIRQRFPAIKKETTEPAPTLLTTGQNCEPYGVETCAWLEDLCCNSSPFDPDDLLCAINWRWIFCKDCYSRCN